MLTIPYSPLGLPCTVVVGAISALLFALLTLLSSSITTYFMSSFQADSASFRTYYAYWNPFYTSPVDVAYDLVRAALRILQDGDVASILDSTAPKAPRTSTSTSTGSSTAGPPTLHLPTPRPSAGIKGFIFRFLIGLPLIGAGSLVHMLVSLPVLAPLQWLARSRGNRRRNNDSARDIAAFVVVVLIVVGAARCVRCCGCNILSCLMCLPPHVVRALYKVYQLTQSMTKRLLLRAEDAILEVN